MAGQTGSVLLDALAVYQPTSENTEWLIRHPAIGHFVGLSFLFVPFALLIVAVIFLVVHDSALYRRLHRNSASYAVRKMFLQDMTLKPSAIVAALKEEYPRVTLSMVATLTSEVHSTFEVLSELGKILLPETKATEITTKEIFCQSYSDDKGSLVLWSSDARETHNIPVTFWDGIDLGNPSNWKCRKEGDTLLCQLVSAPSPLGDGFSNNA
jgi:hypothetical protein